MAFYDGFVPAPPQLQGIALNSEDGVTGQLEIGAHMFDVVIDGASIDVRQEAVRIETHTSGMVGGAMHMPVEKTTYIEIRLIATGLSSTDESVEQMLNIGRTKRAVALEE